MMQQYIEHETKEIYSGDKAHWKDIPAASARPGMAYRPTLQPIDAAPFFEHTGWEYDESLEPIKEADPRGASKEALTPGTDAHGVFTWMVGQSRSSIQANDAVTRINMNLQMEWQWKEDQTAAADGLDTALGMLWEAAEPPEGALEVIEALRNKYRLRQKGWHTN